MSYHQAIDIYLKELDAALRAAGVQDRNAYQHYIEEHIAGALEGEQEPTPERVRQLLVNIGDPVRLAHDAAQVEEPRASRTGVSGQWPGPIGLLRDTRLPPVTAAVTLLGLIVSISLAWVAGGPPAGGGIAGIAALLNPLWWLPTAVVFFSPLFKMWERIAWGISAPLATGAALVVQQGNLLNSVHRFTQLSAMTVAVALPILAATTVILIAIRAVRRRHLTSPSTISAQGRTGGSALPLTERGRSGV